MHTIRLGSARRDWMTHRTKVLIWSMSRRVKRSASCDSESEEENFASQKTSCDGGERRKPAKRNAATTTKNSQPWKKSKVSIFLSLLAVNSTEISYEQKRNPGYVADLHCECQELKPKVERNISFLVLHPFSGVNTVNTVGRHLSGRQLSGLWLSLSSRETAVVVLLYIPKKN